MRRLIRTTIRRLIRLANPAKLNIWFVALPVFYRNEKRRPVGRR
jgi:hypothetical protein